MKEDVVVNAPPGDKDIVSEKQFQDFKLHVEFSLDAITGGAIIRKGAAINDEAAPGPLMFQGDHGLVRFRKVVATPALD